MSLLHLYSWCLNCKAKCMCDSLNGERERVCDSDHEVVYNCRNVVILSHLTLHPTLLGC